MPESPPESTAPPPAGIGLRRAEWVCGLLLTIAAVALRARFATFAGALWRDEVNSVNLAGAATLSDLFHNLQFDSFPMLWLLLLRGWEALAGIDDAAVRLFGAGVAMLLPAAVWWTCRQFAVRPAVSLIICGVSPAFVIWAGVANRAYGLGVTLLALAMGTAWRAYVRPTRANGVAMLVAALLAMHTLFYNALLVACVLGVLTLLCLLRRRPRAATPFVVTGMVGAATMLIYLPMIRNVAHWSMLAKVPTDVPRLIRMMGSSLIEGGKPVPYLFLLVTAGVLLGGCIACVRTFVGRASPAGREADVLLFACATAAAAVVVHIRFLLSLQYPTQIWYYVPLVLVLCVCTDCVVGTVRTPAVLNGLRVALVFAAGMVCAAQTWRYVARPQSNLDVVARQVTLDAAPDDLVVVFPWAMGVTFERYYHGPAPWVTLPDIGFHTWHRYDLLKAMYADPHSAAPVLERIAATLTAGRRVWLVGELPASPTPWPDWPPVPGPEEPKYAWTENSRNLAWGRQASVTIKNLGATVTGVDTGLRGPVNLFEDLPLSVARRPASVKP